MFEQLRLISEKLAEMGNLMEIAGKKIRPQTNICQVAEKAELNAQICAVDSGFYAREMHGADITIVKSAAVSMKYKNSMLVEYDFFVKTPRAEVKTGLAEHELSVYRNLIRLKEESATVIEAMEKYSPDVMILDGSLLPVGEQPQKESDLMKDYEDVFSAYKKMYRTAKQKKLLLLGIVKDSRGKIWIEKYKDKLPFPSYDSIILQHVLMPGERTESLQITKQQEMEGIRSFYLRAVSFDRPLRVEFPCDIDENEAASLVYFLSSIHDSYSYPAILIDVDLRAALLPEEIEYAERILNNYPLSLRRNARPFR